MRAVVSVAGVAVDLAATDAPRWRLLQTLFGICPPTDAAAGVTIRYTVDAPPSPDREPDVRSNDLEIWFGSGGAARHGARVAGQRDGPEITVGGPTDGADAERGFRQVTQHLLASALAEHGLHTLHGAVLHHDGAALLALGGTGAGKSTLAYAALRAGWGVVSDDFAWIADTVGTLTVSGLPKAVNVPADSAVDLPAGAIPMEDDPRQRWSLPHDLVTAHGAYPLHGLLILGHSPSSGALAPFESGPTLLSRVVHANPLGEDPEYARVFFPTAARLSRLPALRFLHDSDPDRRIDVAHALLADVAQRLFV